MFKFSKKANKVLENRCLCGANSPPLPSVFGENPLFRVAKNQSIVKGMSVREREREEEEEGESSN